MRNARTRRGNGLLALVVFTLSGGRYWRWERIALGLALFNGLFLLAAILVKPHPGAVVSSLDFVPVPGGSFNTLLLASTVGATVTPWMIFFQQSASADTGMTARDVKHGRCDTAAGAVLAAIFGVGALIVGAALLTHNGQGIQGFTGAGFPEALTHVAGTAAGTVFVLGLIEAGAVAILICASTAYAAGECAGVSRSFNSSPRNAAVFTPRTSGSRCSPRWSSSSRARRCCRSRSTPTSWRRCCSRSAWPSWSCSPATPR